MFIGRYDHHLETKGRLSVPKKFRSQLEEGAILTEGLDGCLFLYPKSGWQILIDRLNRLPLTRSDARSFVRSMSFMAVEAEIDRLGRILIPDFLRRSAGITSGCIVAGAIDRIEIWDQDRYTAYAAQLSSRREEIAEKLSETGI